MNYNLEKKLMAKFSSSTDSIDSFRKRNNLSIYEFERAKTIVKKYGDFEEVEALNAKLYFFQYYSYLYGNQCGEPTREYFKINEMWDDFNNYLIKTSELISKYKMDMKEILMNCERFKITHKVPFSSAFSASGEKFEWFAFGKLKDISNNKYMLNYELRQKLAQTIDALRPKQAFAPINQDIMEKTLARSIGTKQVPISQVILGEYLAISKPLIDFCIYKEITLTEFFNYYIFAKQNDTELAKLVHDKLKLEDGYLPFNLEDCVRDLALLVNNGSLTAYSSLEFERDHMRSLKYIKLLIQADIVKRESRKGDVYSSNSKFRSSTLPQEITRFYEKNRTVLASMTREELYSYGNSFIIDGKTRTITDEEKDIIIDYLHSQKLPLTLATYEKVRDKLILKR